MQQNHAYGTTKWQDCDMEDPGIVWRMTLKIERGACGPCAPSLDLPVVKPSGLNVHAQVHYIIQWNP